VNEIIGRGAIGGGTAGTGEATPVVALRHVSVTFGGAHALRDVSIEINRHEVHGLVGHNGSGKSTLIKVLAGVYVPERGCELAVNGRAVRLPLVPGQFRSLGLSFVHQNLGLIPSLTVVENVMMSSMARSRAWRHVSWAERRRDASRLLERFDVKLDLDATVSDVSPSDRARLAIVRAVEDLETAAAAHGDQQNYGLLVLDEPTVFLPEAGVKDLFTLVRTVAAGHASVLFVSHDLDDVRTITDRTTVLADGEVRGTVVTKEVSADHLVRLIAGKVVAASRTDNGHSSARDRGRRHGQEILVSSLKTRYIADASFSIADGEVLGVTGLAGSGFEDIPYALFGALKGVGGMVTRDNRTYDLARLSPERAGADGIALVPADRQSEGGASSLSVGENLLLPVLHRYATAWRWLRGRRMRERASQLLREFDVRASDERQMFAELSGGNQQKVILAKWLETHPRLLLLHEATQGVDISAREEIHQLLSETADAGTSVLCASTDLNELTRLCDRVLIFDRGMISAELKGSAITKAKLTRCIYGGENEASP